jgi:hypothetical protein
MNSQDISYSIIGTTIDHGLREMSDDPKRSVRKLADLGKLFSKGRFQSWLFSLFQELLRNDNSSYYQVIDHLLKWTRWNNLKTFGLNVGYNGWTSGAKNIREQISEQKCEIPWILNFHYNPDIDDGIRVRQISDYIRQGKKLGIHCFTICQENSFNHSDEILNLIEDNSDCAFIWQIPDSYLPRESVSRTEDCDNLMLSLPFDGNYSSGNAEKLHEVKTLFGFYTYYDNSDIIEQLPEMTNQIVNEYSSFLVMISTDACSEDEHSRVIEYVYQFRLDQIYPLIPVDFYGDFERINTIIADRPCLFEVSPDGRLKSDLTSSVNIRDFPSLKELLSKAMPLNE